MNFKTLWEYRTTDLKTLHEEFCEERLTLGNYRNSTIRGYKGVFNLFLKFLGDGKSHNIKDVTLDKIREFFFDGRQNRKWSSNTILDYRKALKAFFNWCVEEKKCIKKNPVDGLKRPRLEQPLPESLDKNEALNLLDIVYNLPYEDAFLRERNHAMIAMFIYAGLRKDELLNLRYSDVKFDGMTIKVRGKFAKERLIPLIPELSIILQDYLKERARLKKICPEFFSSFTHNQGLTESGLKHFVKKVKKVFSPDFHIHMLRHTFAVMMLEGGCDIYALSKMMGHTDIRTTTLYLKASVGLLKNEARKHALSSKSRSNN